MVNEEALPLRITGELAGIAEQAMGEASTVICNATRALRTAVGQRKGRLHRVINDLRTVVERTEGVGGSLSTVERIRLG